MTLTEGAGHLGSVGMELHDELALHKGLQRVHAHDHLLQCNA